MLRFIHISDTHIGSSTDFYLYGRNTCNNAKNMIAFLNNDLPFTPDFVLHTGDVTNTPDEESAQLAAQVMSELKYPVYYVCGNHDGRSTLRQYLMQQPPTEDYLFYDFTLDDFHFLVLDTRSDIDPQGYVSHNQLTWLAEKLETSAARSVCLIVHHLPLKIYIDWHDKDMRIMNDDELFAVLRPYRERLRGVFFGHIHRAFTGFRDGILCASAPSTFMQFHAYPELKKASFDTTTQPGYSIVSLTHSETFVAYHTIQEKR